MKFTLNPKSTFGVDVKIPMPGQDEPAILGFTFHHRKTSEMVDREAVLSAHLIEETATQASRLDAQADHILFIAEDWALSRLPAKERVEFTKENIITLLDNYPTAFGAISNCYALEMNGVRQKN